MVHRGTAGWDLRRGDKLYRILIVEDDFALRMATKMYFEQIGFYVYEAENMRKGIEMTKGLDVACVILDISLPDGNGYEVCRRIKEVKDVPVIFISNKQEEESRIDSFLSGGDDYMSKPYSLKELELRIYARIRQYEPEAAPGAVLYYPPIRIECDHRCVICEDRRTGFTAAEFNVLYFLAKNPDKVFSMGQIYDKVWNQPNLGDAHTVQVHLAQVRKKMNALREGHNYIETVWGKGYKFNP